MTKDRKGVGGEVGGYGEDYGFYQKLLMDFLCSLLEKSGVDVDSKHELGWGAIHAAVASKSRKSVVCINLLSFCIITTPLSLLPACLMKWVLIIITFEDGQAIYLYLLSRVYNRRESI